MKKSYALISSEDYSTETAMVFGEVYRYNEEWKFRSNRQGYSGGLYALPAIWCEWGKYVHLICEENCAMQCQAENFIQEIRNKTLPELKQRADNFVQEVKQEYQSAKQQRRITGMGISLEKGQNLSLTKNAPTLKHLQVGC